MNKKPDKQTDEILEHEEAMIPEEEIEAVDEKVEDYEETGDIVDEGYLDKAAKDNMEALRIENQHLKDEYLRALADAENTKKRCAQEIEKNTKYAISSFAKRTRGASMPMWRRPRAREILWRSISPPGRTASPGSISRCSGAFAEGGGQTSVWNWGSRQSTTTR